MIFPPPKIFHDIEIGLQRLLSAPQDLPNAIEWSEPGPLIENADPEYQQLFNKYVKTLNWAVGLAIPWWNALVQNTIASGETEFDAIRINYEIRPAGPASRPEVVGVVRSFWLACSRLNQEVVFDKKVPEEIFLLQWLKTPEHSVLISVLTAMPYWPIGFDENGDWV
jgi:hypothetical protein